MSRVIAGSDPGGGICIHSVEDIVVPQHVRRHRLCFGAMAFPGLMSSYQAVQMDVCHAMTLARGDVHTPDACAADYAITLRAWREAWETRKPEALALGYNERFWKKYRCAPQFSACVDEAG